MHKPRSKKQADELYRTQGDLSAGAAALLAEILISMIIATAVKFLAGEISIPVILLIRYSFSLPILFAIAVYQRGRNALHVVDTNALLLRSAFGLVGLSMWFLALSTIELTLATALSQTLTVFITILAPLILGEKVGVRRWSAVLIGLMGALILLRPGAEGWLQPGVLYGIAAPFFAALMFVFLRKLGRSDAPATTATYYNCFGTLVFGTWCVFASQNWPNDSADWMLLIGCGLLAGIQQFLMALSHKLAPASALAPLHYFAVPIAISIGILVFDERVTWSFLLGTSVIVGSTYYILIRERKVGRSRRRRQ